MRKVVDKGFLAPIIAPEDYIFGGYTKIQGNIVAPDRDWSVWLPPEEAQSRPGLETMNCTGYNTNSALEALMRRMFNIDVDFSDRFTAVMAGTTPNGNSPQAVIESIRHNGLIPESMMPFDDSIQTVEQYYAAVTTAQEAAGRAWLDKRMVGHEWVFTDGLLKDKQERMQDALLYSPLGVSVLAWERDDKTLLYTKQPGEADNHWTVVYGCEPGSHWKVFDSYDSYRKELAWDYNFGFAKRYHIEEKLAQSWLAKLFAEIRGSACHIGVS